jgi:hypothetical protein
MIRVFIGYDGVEAGTWGVLAHSIHTRTNQPVSITPVNLKNLEGILTRDRDPLQSNDFAFSRFLVPWMCNFKGHAIFMDCDMLFRDDISKLWSLRDDETKYSRKNWSSVILFNNEKCRALTPEYVNEAGGLDLHQFKWLDDSEIGYLPKRWNHLVGYDEKNDDVANAHFTTGGAYFDEYAGCDFGDDWFAEQTKANNIEQVKNGNISSTKAGNSG